MIGKLADWILGAPGAPPPRSSPPASVAPTPDSEPPLIWAARRGRIKEIQRLLADGADPEKETFLGGNVLHFICRLTTPALAEHLTGAKDEDTPQVVLQILQKYPHLARQTDPEGLTPVHVAAFAGRDSLLKSVLPLLDVNARSTSKQTPLHLSVLANNPSTSAILLDHGADPNARDANGTTPIMEAARLGNENTVRALLEKGADPHAQDHDGHSAWDLAWQEEGIRALIQQHTQQRMSSRVDEAGSLLRRGM